MWLRNAPAFWQRFIDRVFEVEVCVIISGTSARPILKNIEMLPEVLNRLSNVGLRLNYNKCFAGEPELKYLGKKWLVQAIVQFGAVLFQCDDEEETVISNK